MCIVSKTELNVDFCVIGAGSGGLSFAAGAAQMGASVVLVESGKMGGDCLNTGCVPSKSLIAAAKIKKMMSKGKDLGWDLSGEVDYNKVHKHIHKVIKTIAPHDSIERFQSLGVKVIASRGKFLDKKHLETDEYIVKAKRFIVSTGSYPFIPSIKGIKKVKYYTNEDIFDLEELPKALVVIGGGPIGIELAQAFHRLGSEVTVLEAMTALPKDDLDLTLELKAILLEEGIRIKEGVEINSIEPKGGGLIHYKHEGKSQSLQASHILVATGRRANIQNMNLDKAGIKYSDIGIEVNNKLRTTNRRVYAIGDCIGGYQFTHVAGYHAGIALRNTIFGLRSVVETRAIPWVTYTDPELAHVGSLESQLKEQGVKYQVLEIPFSDIDRSVAEQDTKGRIKVLVSSKGYVLGASILGTYAGELIYPWVMVIQNGLKVSALTGSIAPYPTLNDMTKRVAGLYYRDKLFGSSMQRIVKILMWFK